MSRPGDLYQTRRKLRELQRKLQRLREEREITAPRDCYSSPNELLPEDLMDEELFEAEMELNFKREKR